MESKSVKHFYLFGLLLIFGLLLFIPAKPVYAATDFSKILSQEYIETPVKCGDYYFMYDFDTEAIWQSSSKNGTYKNTGMTAGALTNGEKAYYIKGNKLYKYTFSTGKKVKITSFKKYGDEVDYLYEMGYVYSGKVYISSIVDYEPTTYTYDLNTGDLKKVKSNCMLLCGSGKYVVSSAEYNSDVSPSKLNLYKITSSGLSKICTLAKNGYESGVRIIGSKIYYINYKDFYMNSFTLYKCKLDGTDVTKIKTLSDNKNGEFVMPIYITSKYIDFYRYGDTYRYTYASKELKKIL